MLPILEVFVKLRIIGQFLEPLEHWWWLWNNFAAGKELS